jgi:hypothetical protein
VEGLFIVAMRKDRKTDKRLKNPKKEFAFFKEF